MGRNRSHTRRVAHTYPRGVLEVHFEGYGFVATAEGEFFVPAAKMGGAFDGDLVEVSALPRPDRTKKGQGAELLLDDSDASLVHAGERRAARVVRVLERAFDTLIGRYEVAEPFGVVVPEDSRLRHDIFTLRADNPDIPDGSLVRVRITTFPDRKSAATGVIEEVYASDGDTGVLVDLIVARHKLETEFSPAALEEAEGMRLDVAGALREGYRDLRERFVFTVDPADARDFDDAVSLESVLQGEVADDAQALTGAKWRLGVHIADVSRYVAWDSSIDLDARRRATSVYLADRVIPMLPERLSNDLCSLRPDEDRLSMTVDMYLSEKGVVLGANIYPAVIRSHARLTYGQAEKLFEQVEPIGGASNIATSEGAMPEAGAFANTAGEEHLEEALRLRLRGLAAIAQMRVARRMARGGIEIDAPEAKVRLDSAGVPVAIDLRRKTRATSLIEEAMIMANEAVARSLAEASCPCIYRVHEAPDRMSLEGLVPVLEEFEWFSRINKRRLVAGDARELSAVVELAKGRPESRLVSNLVLRSMKRAVYRGENDGHFGLASEVYAHFTSPIRRYPDLVVHRMLKARATALAGRVTPKYAAQKEAIGWVAGHSSEMERVAQAAARESQECKMVEYLSAFIGNEFEATVSGVAACGLSVRLENTAEGMISLRRLGSEYFAHDVARHTLIGQETGRVFRLGMPIRVVLSSAEPATRTLGFRLCQ